MKMTLIALSVVSVAIASAAFATDAAAQAPDLSGPYQCVQGCAAGPGGPAGPPTPAYVTQNGWDLNLVNEAGIPSRAWIDWPGHIWAQNWDEGAVYSADGMTIQFDRGTVWRRIVALPPPPPPPPYRVRHHRARPR